MAAATGPTGRPRRRTSSSSSRRSTFPGSIVYAKAGNIWIQTGHDVRQLTNSGRDSMPSFSPDGKDVYFIREGTGKAKHTERRPATPGSTSRPPRSRRSRPTARPIPPRSSAAGSRTAATRGSSGCASRSCRRTATRSRSPRTGPNPLPERRDDPALRHDDEEVHPAQARPVRRWATRTRRGRRTAATSRSSRTPATAAAARRRSSSTTRSTRRSSRSPGPGYIAPAWSPDSRYLAATKTDSFGTDVVILDSISGKRAPPADERPPLVLAGLVARRRRDRVPPARRRDRRPRRGQARWHAGQLDEGRRDAADRGVGARRRVAAGLVHPAVGAAGAVGRAEPVRRTVRARLDRAVTPAAGRRPGGVATATSRTSTGSPPGPRRPARSCASASTPTLRRCRPRSSPDVGGVERFARLLVDVAAPARGRGQAESRVLRGVRLGGARGAGADPGRDPGGHAGRHRREARRHRVDGGAPGRRAVRRPRRRRDHRQPVPRRGGHRAAPRASRPPRLRPVPDVEPGRARAPVAASSSDGDGARRSRSTSASPGGSTAWGPGGTVGLVVGATAPAELAEIRQVAPGPAVPRPGRRRPGRRDRSRARRRARPATRPAVGRPGGGLLVNVTRGIAAGGGRPDHGTGGRGRPRDGRRRVGRPPPCATLAAARGPFDDAHREPADRCHAPWSTTMPLPSGFEWVLIIVHRPADPRPGQAAGRRRRRSARASASSARPPPRSPTPSGSTPSPTPAGPASVTQANAPSDPASAVATTAVAPLGRAAAERPPDERRAERPEAARGGRGPRPERRRADVERLGLRLPSA